MEEDIAAVECATQRLSAPVEQGQEGPDICAIYLSHLFGAVIFMFDLIPSLF
jgi:hypothetical protein